MGTTIPNRNAPPEALSKVRALIVDDTPSNLITLEAILNGYEVFSARSGKEALDLLEKTDVDVIILDIQMPEMDGYETARRIKQMERCHDTPIVFITAIFKEDPYVKKGYEVGGIDYFAKPFDADILKMKIDIYASFRQRDALLKEKEKRIRELEELLQVAQQS